MKGKKIEGKNKRQQTPAQLNSSSSIFLPHIFLPAIRSGSSFRQTQSPEGKKMGGKNKRQSAPALA
jgi:hypothetical protein